MNLMTMFEYRADFFFWAFVSGMWTVFNYFFIHILVSASRQIGGWNQSELFVLMSVFTIFDAFTWSFFYFNMNRYVNNVFSGELDRFLVKPVNPQFLLSVEHNSYNNLVRLVIGIGMLLYSTSQLAIKPTVFDWILFVPLLLLGFLLLYSLWFIIATLSFWVERLNNINDIIPSLRRLSQIPRPVYEGVSSFLFCGVFPVVLMTSIPAEVLTNRLDISWVSYFVAFALGSFVVCRLFFNFSLRKYSSAGS